MNSNKTDYRATSAISRLGYFYAMLAAVFWAVSGTSAKFLFNSGVSPFQLVQMRITVAAFILFLWLFIRNKALLKIYKKDIFYFIMLGSLGMAAVQFTYLFAISKINVAAAILIQYTTPAFIALYSVIVIREKLSCTTVIAIIGSLTGCYLVVGAYNLNVLSMNRVGIITAVLSAISFACYSVMGEYGMRKYNPLTVLFYGMLVAAVIWNILYPPFQSFFQKYSAIQWTWILYIAVFGTVVPFSLYFEGINLIRSARASITATLEPITAGIISYIFLNENMEFLQITGGILVIACVILLQLKQEYDDKAPSLLRNRN